MSMETRLHRLSGHGDDFAYKMRTRPELKAYFCQHCEIGYDDENPRYADTDHCTWCQEEIERGGRMIIGAGLEEAQGWIQIPENVMDEAMDKAEYNRRHREKTRVRNRCACGKKIDNRSTRCAPCAAREHQARRARELA